MAATRTYVAFLRAINLARTHRVPMAELRDLLADLGYTDVTTLLQSGNVILSASGGSPATIAADVEAAIEKQYGFTAPCVVLTEKEFRDAVATNPLADLAEDGKRMQVTFLSKAPTKNALSANNPVELDPDHIVHKGRVIYQWCPVSSLDSPSIPDFVGKKLGVHGTARNWNTLEKLAAKLPS